MPALLFFATKLYNQEALSPKKSIHKKTMKISITNYPLSLKIGHFQSERSFTREVFISLELELKAANPKNLEDLERTIDYGAVLSFLEKKYSDSSYHLIETLLYKVADDLMQTFPLLDKLKVKIEKTLIRAKLIKGARITVEESFTKENFS